MASTFSGLEIGKRGLDAHRQALQTTGHNISNADNKQYSRQRVVLSAADPLYEPSFNRAALPGQIGQGVEISAIERIRDSFIDDRIIETVGIKSYWETRNNYLSQLENVFNEPAGTNLRTVFTEFWNSWEDLSNYPEESAHRAVVKEKAISLSTRFKDLFLKIDQLKNQANAEIESNVNLLNTMTESISKLNERISKLEALGDKPNDLYDKRDKLVEDLSSLVDVNIGRSDKDEFMIFIGEQILIQGGKVNRIQLKSNIQKEGGLDLVWEKSGDMVFLSKGKIESLIEVRDFVGGGRIDQIDSMALNIADIVNEIHRDGFGISGNTNLDFFNVKNLSLNSFGEYDSNGDGQNDITSVFRISGRNTLDPDKPVGISGILTFQKPDKESTPVQISYNENDTLKSIILKINTSESGVVAYINHDKQFSLKATVSEDSSKNNFMIRHLEDSGQLLVGLTGILAGSGIEGAFDFKRLGELNKLQASSQDITLTPHYHPSSYLALSEFIQNNPSNIATGRGKDVGGVGDYNSPGGEKDGRNALLIASALKEKPIMLEDSKTIEAFYAKMISKIGTEAREANQEFTIQSELMTNLENVRQSVMGVSLDEEMANMVQFQQSYNASAKMIQTVNEMLDTIINKLGA